MASTPYDQILAHLVKGIVNDDENVVVDEHDTSRGKLLEVRVSPDDLGRVIGRGGKTAKALRTVMSALAKGERIRIDVIDTDEED